MKYAYFPGCSLMESAREFDVSVRAVLNRLGAELIEIPGWTCCGASAAESVDKLMSLVLPARSMAISESNEETAGFEILAPCSACYLNLLRTQRELAADRGLRAQVNEVLAVEGLEYTGRVRIRHIIDVLRDDIGPKAISAQVTAPWQDMPVAAYYGCQILRPYPVFDNPSHPTSMEPILAALGAKAVQWDKAGRCCGASLMATHPEAAVHSVAGILAQAAEAGAELVLTVCPLCQMNLEAYQAKAERAGGVRLPVLYLTQFVGMALGLNQREMMLGSNMTMTGTARSRIDGKAWVSKEAEIPAEEQPLEPGTNL